jgi:hypothetical protein
MAAWPTCQSSKQVRRYSRLAHKARCALLLPLPWPIIPDPTLVPLLSVLAVCISPSLPPPPPHTKKILRLSEDVAVPAVEVREPELSAI